jgi:hypothetical protein
MDLSCLREDNLRSDRTRETRIESDDRGEGWGELIVLESLGIWEERAHTVTVSDSTIDDLGRTTDIGRI